MVVVVVGGFGAFGGEKGGVWREAVGVEGAFGVAAGGLVLVGGWWRRGLGAVRW